MGHIAASELAYAHPGGETLFFDVSFSISPGEKVGLIGDNGVGKTTLLRLINGDIPPDEGRVNVGGTVLHMAQDIGFGESRETVHEMLLRVAPPELRTIGQRMVVAERRLAGGDNQAGVDLASVIGEWGDQGGYELESRWDSAIHRILPSGLGDVGEKDSAELSGGERKRLVLELMFTSDADVLLLDEPDNYLDIPAKQWMEDQVRDSAKTILMISHDRDTLSRAVSKIITLESSGCWVHGGSYSTYPEARRKRQEKLGDDLQRWRDEERRLFRYYKLMKQRAALNDKNAPKADAAETRWKRFVAAGAPPAPARAQKIVIRLKGSETGRRALRIERLSIPGLITDFSDEVRFGERVGLIGPNGSGKTSLLRLVMGERDIRHSGEIILGSRVLPGQFTQVSDRPDFEGRTILELVEGTLGDEQRSMAALARYGLQGAAADPSRPCQVARRLGWRSLIWNPGPQSPPARRANRPSRPRLVRGTRDRTWTRSKAPSSRCRMTARF